MNSNPNDVTTEAFAQQEANELKVQESKQAQPLKDTLELLQNLLAGHTSETRQQLICLCSEESFISSYRNYRETAWVLTAIHNIYQYELASAEPTTLLDHVSSIEDIRSYINHYKFLIWNIEFDTDADQAFEDLTQAVKDHAISVTAIVHLVQLYSLDKKQLLILLVCYWQFQKLNEQAHAILLQSLLLYPQDPDFTSHLQNVNKSMNQSEKGESADA